MSDTLTCPICGHKSQFTLVPHLRDQHQIELEAFGRQYPQQPLHSPAFAAFVAERNVTRRDGVLHYQLDVAGTRMTARHGVNHPLIPDVDPTFVWTPPCRDVAEALEHNERVFLYGPSGTGKSSLVRQIAA